MNKFNSLSDLPYLFFSLHNTCMYYNLLVHVYREPEKGMQNIAKQDPSRARKKS